MRHWCWFLLLGLTACGSQEVGTGTDARDPLAGRSLVVTEVRVDGRPHRLVPGTRIELRFERGTLRASAGCNTMLADYVIEGDRLLVTSLGSTEMGCPDPRMAQDRWLAGLLAPPLVIGTDPLTLTSGTTVLTLVDREQVVPDVPLRGTRWHLESLVTGDTVSSVPAGVAATLHIDHRGRATFDTGCNGGGARVEVTGGRLRWSDVAVHLRGCHGPRAEVERRVLAVLRGTTAYTVDGERLTVRRGERALVYRAG